MVSCGVVQNWLKKWRCHVVASSWQVQYFVRDRGIEVQFSWEAVVLRGWTWKLQRGRMCCCLLHFWRKSHTKRSFWTLTYRHHVRSIPQWEDAAIHTWETACKFHGASKSELTFYNPVVALTHSCKDDLNRAMALGSVEWRQVRNNDRLNRCRRKSWRPNSLPTNVGSFVGVGGKSLSAQWFFWRLWIERKLKQQKVEYGRPLETGCDRDARAHTEKNAPRNNAQTYQHILSAHKLGRSSFCLVDLLPSLPWTATSKMPAV